MKKELFVIFDVKSNVFGEVISAENVEEAKRSFILSLVNLPDVLCDDLYLYKIGDLSILGKSVGESGYTVYCPHFTFDSNVGEEFIVCNYFDVQEDVKAYRIRQAEYEKIRQNIHVEYSAKKFVDNVEKLSRYFAKKDKRFNK